MLSFLSSKLLGTKSVVASEANKTPSMSAPLPTKSNLVSTSTSREPLSTVPKVTGARFISRAEVAKHNKEEDCWLIIRGRVYDCTKFVPMHPGGNIMCEKAGADSTVLYDEIGHTEEADRELELLYIGELLPE